MNLKIVNNRLQLADIVSNPKKITMTRLGAILGVNSWVTPFEAWCDMLRVYTAPFEDNASTIAGKIIEPKVAEYIARMYKDDKIINPETFYGNTYQNYMYKKDFFQKEKIFGGMWDAVRIRDWDTMSIKEVFEQKTGKRSEDWLDGCPPYYLLQGLGYAHMLGVNELTMVMSFLDDKNLAHPDKFKPSPDNTIFEYYMVDSTKVELPNGDRLTIGQCFETAEQWYNTHILTGTSPEFDPNNPKHQEILDTLFTEHIVLSKNDEELKQHMKAYNEINAQLEKYSEQIKIIKELEKKAENLKKSIVIALDDKSTSKKGKVVVDDFILQYTTRAGVNTEKLKEDGLYEEYSKSTLIKTLKRG